MHHLTIGETPSTSEGVIGIEELDLGRARYCVFEAAYKGPEGFGFRKVGLPFVVMSAKKVGWKEGVQGVGIQGSSPEGQLEGKQAKN